MISLTFCLPESDLCYSHPSIICIRSQLHTGPRQQVSVAGVILAVPTSSQKLSEPICLLDKSIRQRMCNLECLVLVKSVLCDLFCKKRAIDAPSHIMSRWN